MLSNAGREVLQASWSNFWHHCADPSAYFEDMEQSEVDEGISEVERLLNY